MTFASGRLVLVHHDSSGEEVGETAPSIVEQHRYVPGEQWHDGDHRPDCTQNGSPEVIALIDVVRRRHERSTGRIVAWVIAILVFPVAGTIAYFLANAGGGGSAPRDTQVGGRAL